MPVTLSAPRFAATASPPLPASRRVTNRAYADRARQLEQDYAGGRVREKLRPQVLQLLGEAGLATEYGEALKALEGRSRLRQGLQAMGLIPKSEQGQVDQLSARVDEKLAENGVDGVRLLDAGPYISVVVVDLTDDKLLGELGRQLPPYFEGRTVHVRTADGQTRWVGQLIHPELED